MVYIYKNIIWLYRNYLVFIAGLSNFLLETSGLVNNLYISIINYKAKYKYSSIGNFIQSETNYDDNKMFFTD